MADPDNHVELARFLRRHLALQPRCARGDRQIAMS